MISTDYQNKYLSKRFSITILLALWISFFLLVSLLQYELWYIIPILASLLWDILFFGGLIILIIIAIAAFKNKSWKYFLYRFIPVIAILCFGIWSGGGFPHGISYEIYLTFRMNTYEEIVRHVTEGRLSNGVNSGSSYEGVGFEIEEVKDGKKMIIFPSGIGIVDNWCGLAWDPTDIIGVINEKSKRLFGGDLISTKNKSDHWYLVCFT